MQPGSKIAEGSRPKGSKIPAFLTGLLLVAALPIVPPATADTYMVEFGGEQYTENSDPLARFESFPVTENADEPGIVTLPPVSVETTTWVNTTVQASNTEIETLLTPYGISRSDIAAQISTLLDYNSTYDEARQEAVAYIQDGLFREAQSIVTGTPADIIIYCGDFRYDWVIGIPVPLTCVWPSDAHFDVHFLATVTELRLDGTNVAGLDVYIDVRGFSVENHGAIILGVGYRPVDEWVGGEYGNELSGGIFSHVDDLGITTTGTLIFDGLTGTARSGEASIDKSFLAGDEVYFSLGELRGFRSKTVTGVFHYSATVITVAWSYVPSSQGWFVVVNLVEGYSSLGPMELYLPLGTSHCDRFDAEVTGYPNRFMMHYNKFDLDDSLGDKVHLDIARLGSSIGLFNMEARATYTKACDPEATFQFVGFPNWIKTRFDMGGDDTNQVNSADLTKYDEDTSGYFRTILFTAHADGKRLDGSIVDVSRVNIVWGKEDIFDGDKDDFAEIGANFEKCVDETSMVRIIARDVPTIDTAGMKFEPWSPCNDWTHYSVVIQEIVGCPTFGGCNLEKGYVRESPDTEWFNAWWWAISDEAIGNQNACFQLESGHCP